MNSWKCRARAYRDFIKGLGSRRDGATVDLRRLGVTSSVEPVDAYLPDHREGETDLQLRLSAVSAAPSALVSWNIDLSALVRQSAGEIFAFALRRDASEAAINVDWIEIASAGTTSRYQPPMESHVMEVRLPLLPTSPVVTISASLADGALLCREFDRDSSFNAMTEVRQVLFSLLTPRIFEAPTPTYCNLFPAVDLGTIENEVAAMKPEILPILYPAGFFMRGGNVASVETSHFYSVDHKRSPFDFAHVERPLRGDFQEVLVDVATAPPAGTRLTLLLVSPHINPATAGRLYYYVAIDGRVLYHEDISFFTGLNRLVLPAPTMALQIGLIAARDAIEWNWGSASRLLWFGAEAIDGDRAVVTATSPVGVIHAQPETLDEFFQLGWTVLNR